MEFAILDRQPFVGIPSRDGSGRAQPKPHWSSRQKLGELTDSFSEGSSFLFSWESYFSFPEDSFGTLRTLSVLIKALGELGSSRITQVRIVKRALDP